MKAGVLIFAFLFSLVAWVGLGLFLVTSDHVKHVMDLLLYGVGTLLYFWITRGALFMTLVAALGYTAKFLAWVKGY